MIKQPLTSKALVLSLIFCSGVLKVTCFGHDQRDNRFRYFSKFSLTPLALDHVITHVTPVVVVIFKQTLLILNDTILLLLFLTMLKEGMCYSLVPNNYSYLLQLEAYVGVSLSPVYSCSALNIVGGDTSLTCAAPASIPLPPVTCESVSSITTDDLIADTKPGPYCFSTDGLAGIDDNIAAVPVNADCDPRVSCDFANLVQLCQADITQTILDPTSSPHVASCSLTAFVPTTTTTTEAAPTTVDTTTVDVTSTVETTTTEETSTVETTTETTTESSSVIESTIETTATDVVSTVESSTVEILTTETTTESSSTVEVTTETTTIPSAYATTTCVSSNPYIAANSTCDPNVVTLTCSGKQLAVCLKQETLTGYYGVFGLLDCPAGTVCDLSCGSPVCSFASDVVCPPKPAASSTTTDIYGSAPETTTTESSVETFAPETTGESVPVTTTDSVPVPTTDYAPVTTTDGQAPEVTSTPCTDKTYAPETTTAAPDTTTPCTDKTESTYAPETTTAAPDTTTPWTDKTESASPTETPAECYPQIAADQDCQVESSPLRCSGAKVAICAWKTVDQTVVGRYVHFDCAAGLACRQYGDVAVCDYESKPCST